MATRSGSATYTSTPNPTTLGGWSGATSTPAAVGDSGAAGYSENAIARPDFVPYQTFATTFYIGIVGFHIEDINIVKLAIGSGPWINCTSMTTNADTGTTSYNFAINPAHFADGVHEARAIAYPTSGVPRVISGLYFNANSGATLPAITRYVDSANGNDTTGNGLTVETAVATKMKAAQLIRTAQGNGDGASILSADGDYAIGPSAAGEQADTTNRWMRIAAAPNETAVAITSTSGNGMNTKLLQLEDVGIESAISSDGTLVDSIWMSGCSLVGADRTTSQVGPNSSWTNKYLTDSTVTEVLNFFTPLTLVRNVSVTGIGDDIFSNCGMVINATIHDFERAPGGHADVYQNTQSNVILYGVDNSDNTGIINSAIIFESDAQDIAIVDCVLHGGSQEGGIAIYLQHALRNVLFKNCNIVGNIYYEPDDNEGKLFEPTNVVFEGCTFTDPPTDIPGVTIR